ncbi:MAG: Gfo/Idh/MocA family oxidoreductase [Lachnospiraceae bacterium]|nr:Gfo/Idh/MocA family oxidoreductase [Lachnospiraceae bacterium]
MRRFNVGILGCGVISRTYLADIKEFYRSLNVIACADVNDDIARKLADEFGIGKAYSTEELLKDEEVEIVINLTPPSCHVGLNRKLIEAGRHVFSEKPFAHSMEEAESVLRLAQDHGVRIGCAPDTFLASGLQSIRHYLDAGIIGTPFMVSANMMIFGAETWHRNPGFFYEENCGPVYDMAPYYISAIVSLLGPVGKIAAFSSRPHTTRHLYVGDKAGEEIPCLVDTSYTVILYLRDGVIANLNLSFDVYRTQLPMFEIFGDRGTLSYPDPNFGGGTPKVYRKEQLTDPIFNKDSGSKERSEKFFELPELFPRVRDYSRGIGVAELADSIDSGRDPRTGGDFLLHVTEVLYGIRTAVKTGSIYETKTTANRPEALPSGEGFLS